MIEKRAGVRLVRWQKLYSSFVYLRRLMELLDQRPPGLQKRVLAFSRVPRSVLGCSQHAVGSRLIDRWIGTDLPSMDGRSSSNEIRSSLAQSSPASSTSARSAVRVSRRWESNVGGDSFVDAGRLGNTIRTFGR
jgi:hypothetical protein